MVNFKIPGLLPKSNFSLTILNISWWFRPLKISLFPNLWQPWASWHVWHGWGMQSVMKSNQNEQIGVFRIVFFDLTCDLLMFNKFWFLTYIWSPRSPPGSHVCYLNGTKWTNLNCCRQGTYTLNTMVAILYFPTFKHKLEYLQFVWIIIVKVSWKSNQPFRKKTLPKIP